MEAQDGSEGACIGQKALRYTHWNFGFDLVLKPLTSPVESNDPVIETGIINYRHNRDPEPSAAG